MRTFLIIAALVINVSGANAQNFSEWVKQKETQIRYLAEQIASLKMYGEVINKGYDIAHAGLKNIFGIKDDDYKEHAAYFLSLWKVKADIKNYSKALSIYKMYSDIKARYELINSSVKSFLAEKEIAYINNVFASLISGAGDLVDELGLVISDSELELKDDERVQRIDKIYLQMQDRYEFCQSFLGEIKLLVINRLREKNQLDKVSSLYGIK